MSLNGSPSCSDDMEIETEPILVRAFLEEGYETAGPSSSRSQPWASGSGNHFNLMRNFVAQAPEEAFGADLAPAAYKIQNDLVSTPVAGPSSRKRKTIPVFGGGEPKMFKSSEQQQSESATMAEVQAQGLSTEEKGGPGRPTRGLLTLPSRWNLNEKSNAEDIINATWKQVERLQVSSNAIAKVAVWAKMKYSSWYLCARGCKLNVRIQYVWDCATFLVLPENDEQLMETHNRLLTQYAMSASAMARRPLMDEIVVVPHKFNMFARGRVLGIAGSPFQPNVTITYLDFGGRATFPLTEVRELDMTSTINDRIYGITVRLAGLPELPPAHKNPDLVKNITLQGSFIMQLCEDLDHGPEFQSVPEVHMWNCHESWSLNDKIKEFFQPL